MINELPHGGDTRTASDTQALLEAIGLVLELLEGTLEEDLLTRGEAGKVRSELAAGVRFDHKLNGALLVRRRDGGVRPNDRLVFLVLDLVRTFRGPQKDDAGDLTARNLVFTLLSKAEVVDVGVVVVLFNLLEGERDPSVLDKSADTGSGTLSSGFFSLNTLK